MRRLLSVRLTRRGILLGGLGLGGVLVMIMGAWLIRPDRDPFQPQRLRPIQPPLTQFTSRPAREAGQTIKPSELVIGVSINGESRAYPLNMLAGPSQEVVNDTLGGKAIAVTW